MVSRKEQAEIQSMIDNMSIIERQELYDEISSNLLKMSSALDYRAFTDEENKSSEIFIEILTRIEAIQQNKGWWFRTRRRMSLILEYISKRQK